MKAFLAVLALMTAMIVNLVSIGVMRYLSVTYDQYVTFPTEVVVDLTVGVFTTIAVAVVIAEIYKEKKNQKRVY